MDQNCRLGWHPSINPFCCVFPHQGPRAYPNMVLNKQGTNLKNKNKKTTLLAENKKQVKVIT